MATFGSCGRSPGSEPVVGVIGADSTAIRGALLGGWEAAHAAGLIGKNFKLETAFASDSVAAEREARRLIRRGVLGIIGGGDEATCRQLGRVARHAKVLFLNTGCQDSTLRGERYPTTFSIAPTAKARLETAGSDAPPTARVVQWHAGLTPFGAAQLNQRFLRAFGEPGSEADWAEWMAVKVVWEAALRVGHRPDSLLVYLRSRQAEFDGHKGEPLRFDSTTRQLIQPLYLVDRDHPDRELQHPTPSKGLVPLRAALAALPSSTPLVLVTNEGSKDLTIIDPLQRQVIATIPLGERPRGIQIGHNGRSVFVALSDEAVDTESDNDAIVELDLANGEVVARHPAGSDPEQFTLSADGRKLFASNEDAGTVAVVELTHNRLRTTLPVGIEPEGVARSPDGRWIYVTAETSNTVTVVDADSEKVAASFLVGLRPRAVAFSPDGARAYVTNEIGGTLTVVDATKHSILETVRLGPRAKPVGVVVSPDGSRIYVATGHANTVAVVDAATNQMISTIPVGRRPWGIALSADGRKLYTANGLSDDVTIIDTERQIVEATIPAGQRPWGVVVVERPGRLAQARR
jgi:PQQ-dependent catabolism-associated beta-propeller protein